MPDDEPELEGPKGFRSRLYVHRNGVNQNFGGLGIAPIEFTTPIYDTLGEWFTGAGNWHFRPRRAGWYLLIAQARRLSPPVFAATDQLEIRVIGTPWFLVDYPLSDLTSFAYTRTSGILHLLPTDIVQVWWVTNVAWPNDTVDGNQYATYFCAHRLS